MKKIFFRNGVLIYYNNPAGYRAGDKVILDSMFDRKELKDFLREKEGLEVEIREVVYDRLSEGEVRTSEGGEVIQKGTLRIYQLKKDSPILMRFIGLAEREKRGFGLPQENEYELVYEGETGTFDLEDIWDKFKWNPPKELEGHTLSISDILVLTEGEVSRCFYVDLTSFKEIAIKLNNE